MVASGANPGPAIAYQPGPICLSTTTQNFGTVASLTAVIIFCTVANDALFSTAVPTMKPGTSEGKISGTLKASHNWMNRVALSAESTNNTPP